MNLRVQDGKLAIEWNRLGADGEPTVWLQLIARYARILGQLKIQLLSPTYHQRLQY